MQHKTRRIPLKKKVQYRGLGTNYINIYHESKAERISEAIIWLMDASDWMMRLK